MRMFRILIVGPCLATLSLVVQAADPAELANLFTAEMQVADESSQTRNTVLTELLSDVLRRVSGNSGIAGQPTARELLQAAPSLVQQYRYRSVAGDDGVERYLWARFDQPVVERMMRERNLPVWTQRPRVLLWVATEQAGQRRLLNFENAPEARAAVDAVAHERGIPLQLPLMDLEDQANLTPADLWSGYEAAIERASARYPHDLVLTGRLRAQPDGKWSGVWSLLDEGAGQTLQTPSQALPAALAFALEQAQNLLAARYAPLPGTEGASGTLVRISDVHDLAGYGRLMALLEGLEPVARVALRHVGDAHVVVEVRLRSSERDLVRALEADRRLAGEPAPAQRLVLPGSPARAHEPTPGNAMQSLPEPDADLYYRLLN